MEKIKIIDPYKCDQCGKLFGKTNTTYQDIEIWLACDCAKKDVLYLLNTDALEYKIKSIQHILSTEEE